MDKAEVILRFKNTFGKTMIAELTSLAKDPRIPLECLHALCYDRSNDQIAFRAAWVLEYIAAHDTARFAPILSQLISLLSKLENRSCQRHFTKILMWITHPKSPDVYQQILHEADKDELVEVVFSWLIDPRTPVAIQVNCLDILHPLSQHADWIPDELEKQIHYLLLNGSPAMQSRGRRVLKKIRRAKNGVGDRY